LYGVNTILFGEIKMSDKFYVYCHDCEKLVAVCFDLDMASVVSSAYFKATKHNHTMGTEKYFKGAYPDLVLEPKKAVIMLVSGCTSIVEKPDTLAVEIHDYDIEGDWVKENPDCFTDIEGDRYQVISYPATEIKFSANGKQCFTDVEIEKDEPNKYINHYRCPDCNTEWQDEWSCQCDDECPVCATPYSPYMSEDINEQKTLTILYHDITYSFVDDVTINHGDCEYEHIHYMITEGYKEGELNKTDPDDENKTIRGYWKMV
jgi:hypothetical protein